MVTGRLLNSVSGDPIEGAAVQIDELRRQTTSAADGTFSFENVPPGIYQVSVRSSGYSSRRTEIAVATAGVERDVKAVHGDVHALIDAGLPERTEANRVAFPFDAIRVEFTLRAA